MDNGGINSSYITSSPFCKGIGTTVLRESATLGLLALAKELSNSMRHMVMCAGLILMGVTRIIGTILLATSKIFEAASSKL